MKRFHKSGAFWELSSLETPDLHAFATHWELFKA